MKIPQEELNDWAERAVKANGLLLKAMASGGAAGSYAGEAQRVVNGLFQAILRAGADDPRYQRLAPEDRPQETSLELLDSPANRRYLEAMRVAAECAREVDRERGCLGDGPAEHVEDWLAGIEYEVFGPVGLRE